MTVFNWDESDISWFLKRFKDEDMEISSRTVSRNHPRKKGQIRGPTKFH